MTTLEDDLFYIATALGNMSASLARVDPYWRSQDHFNRTTDRIFEIAHKYQDLVEEQKKS